MYAFKNSPGTPFYVIVSATMDVLKWFHEIARMPLREWKDTFPDHLPVGVYNAYVPDEMFHAAGLTPIYLFHQQKTVETPALIFLALSVGLDAASRTRPWPAIWTVWLG